ncbi:hypothetical protein NQD34_012277 [Periophthalmus magnuspinnatus]|nr:hypothetical protein NQD34_012277 [Periophthalmus magnuspinnatus]
MAAVTYTACAEGLQCFICLEVFTDPVTTPCGHTFCRVCINQHWNNNRPYTCPLCKHKFSSRPDLQINPALAMIVNELKNGAKMRDSEVEIMILEPRFATSEELGFNARPWLQERWAVTCARSPNSKLRSSAQFVGRHIVPSTSSHTSTILNWRDIHSSNH